VAVNAELMARLSRYGIAALGPLSVAASQFLLSFILLRQLDVADFGRFAFLLIVSQFSTSLWSALFTAPLLVAAARSGTARNMAEIRALAASSSLALLPGTFLFAGLTHRLGGDWGAAALFGMWSAVALLRHFLRAWFLAHQRPLLTMTSDLSYALALQVALVIAMTVHGPDFRQTGLLLLAAASCGLLPFLTRLAGVRTVRFRLGDIAGYRPIWQRDGRWSLIGVFATELTVNSQSYLVTMLSGAKAFAPIAATALLVRPVTVAINALGEFERARFAHGLEEGRPAEVQKARGQLRSTLLLAWLATLLLAALLLHFAPDFLFHGKFAGPVLWTGAALWFAVIFARAFHGPDDAVLLAMGQFRRLARLSSITAILSLLAVAGLIMLAGPLWSIAGIAIGEGVFALFLYKEAGARLKWQLQSRSSSGPASDATMALVTARRD